MNSCIRIACATGLAATLLVSGCGRSPGEATEATVARVTTDRHRPQFHFTPPAHWMNDPNGLVYFAGEYHLFYQYYPDDTVWGPMHWGHAVSRDLVHWDDLPIALYPDEHGYIFSGSAVVDWHDTSGFGSGGEPPLVAIFTYHDPERASAGTNDHETQGIAYSNDRGRSWTKYEHNPVLPNADGHRDFRDPNVFWHAPTERWVMVLSVSDHVELWVSPDLRSWEFSSAFGHDWGAHGGVWECPDLFPLNVAGTDAVRWVLILNLNPGGPQGGSGTQYFVGDFDGRTFTIDERFAETLRNETAVWLDWGRDNYAGVTWSDVPESDGRRLFIGWMSNWDYAQQVPTAAWRSAMTVPRALTLVETPAGLRVFSSPVAELTRLRGEAVSVPVMRIRDRRDIGVEGAFSPAQSELQLAFDLDRTTADEVGIVLSNPAGEEYRLGYRAGSGMFVSDRRRSGEHSFADTFADRVHEAPRLVQSNALDLRLLLDAASIEMFADGGATVLTDIYFPSTPFDRLAVYAIGGEAALVGGTVYPLRSIW